MPFISNSIYGISNDNNTSMIRFNESEVYITKSLKELLPAPYPSSMLSYYGINHYKKGNHFYFMHGDSNEYSTNARISFYDVDLTTHVSTLKTYNVGTLSDSSYLNTIMLSVIDGKALISCDAMNKLCVLYDFDNNVITKVTDGSSQHRVYATHQVGYIGWYDNTMTNLKTFVNTVMPVRPIALIKDDSTGRDVWISGIDKNDDFQYMFFDDSTATYHNISSFPDCKFIEPTSGNNYIYDITYGMNRNSDSKRNLIVGYIVENNVPHIYDVYGFNSSKSELKLRMMLAPNASNVYRINNKVLIASPTFTYYKAGGGNGHLTSTAYAIGDKPLEWYGFIFHNGGLCDTMIKYTLDE